MPWLPMYLYECDADIILEMLNNDPEVAFIVSDGPSRWKAVDKLSSLPTGRFTIWHLPTGALPFLGYEGTQVGWIDNPWQGWREQRPSFHGSEPNFGSQGTGVLWLNQRSSPAGSENQVWLSSFEWIGHHYDMIGFKASAETDRWWKRLRSAVQRKTTKVPRGGPTKPTKPEIFAFPDALRAIEQGIPAAINP